jgi:hypothetical protein
MAVEYRFTIKDDGSAVLRKVEKKNLPLFPKIMYIIGRGKENVLLLRSIFALVCVLAFVQAGRLFSRAETQKDGKRNEGRKRKENGRYYNPIEAFFQYIKPFIELFFQRLNKQSYSRRVYGP